MTISIDADHRGLIVRTPYSAQFVSELKRRVPRSDLSFTGKPENAWIVEPSHAATVQKLIMEVYREAVSLPVVGKASPRLERAELRVEYVGQCKQRATGDVSAYGHDGQNWSVVLPESVLKQFFGQDVEISVEGDENRSRVKPASLYAVLLINQSADSAAIKSAYRRMARLTHPDVNHEPDAAEQFKAVNHAWNVLSDPQMRRRYDAGLALEASLKSRRRGDDFFTSLNANNYFRAPLRCGLLTVDGERKLGRVIVSKIHQWDDIVRADGKTMVSSWKYGAENYQVEWV